MSSDNPLLFAVTAKDCDWSYTKGTGAGGQKRNKTSSAVHCTHRTSGAHGYSEASRSQLDNKRDAFRKMAESGEFRAWHRLEVSRITGRTAQIGAAVEQSMGPRNLVIEGRVDGLWVPIEQAMQQDEADCPTHKPILVAVAVEGDDEPKPKPRQLCR